MSTKQQREPETSESLSRPHALDTLDAASQAGMALTQRQWLNEQRTNTLAHRLEKATRQGERCEKKEGSREKLESENDRVSTCEKKKRGDIVGEKKRGEDNVRKHKKRGDDARKNERRQDNVRKNKKCGDKVCKTDRGGDDVCKKKKWDRITIAMKRRDGYGCLVNAVSNADCLKVHFAND